MPASYSKALPISTDTYYVQRDSSYTFFPAYASGSLSGSGVPPAALVTNSPPIRMLFKTTRQTAALSTN